MQKGVVTQLQYLSKKPSILFTFQVEDAFFALN